LVVTGGVSAAD